MSDGAPHQPARYDRRVCSICLERYTESNPSVLYPCGHSYHLQCAESWFLRSAKCPVCDQNIRDPGMFSVDTDCRPDRGPRDSTTSLDAASQSVSMADSAGDDSSPTCVAAPRPPPPPPRRDSSGSDAASPSPDQTRLAAEPTSSGPGAANNSPTERDAPAPRPRPPCHVTDTDSDHEGASLLRRDSVGSSGPRRDEDSHAEEETNQTPPTDEPQRRRVGVRSLPGRLATTASALLCCWRFR
mmetsp:Transcript_46171/g.142346  ORF Transcript_46171/g.142346 Transcript_46171/m.142346 type:complete len:242 (+) Transcript_46171:132-857(+)